MKKRNVTIAILLILSLLFALTLTACNESEDGVKTDTLVIYNCEDYIDDSAETNRLTAFKAHYKEVTGNNLEIVYTTYDTNETMLTKVLNNDATSVDIICPSEYAIQKLMANGRLANISELVAEYSKTYPYLNLDKGTMSNTEPMFVDSITAEFTGISTGSGTGNMVDYMVPYMWGTMGLLYNVKYVTKEDLDSQWSLLWNVNGSEVLENKILVKDSVRETFVAGIMYLLENDMLPEKYTQMPITTLINCTDDELLDLVEQVLTEQRSHISGYEVDFGKDDMLNELVYIDLAWSGDAMWAIEESYDEDNLYYNPRTGEYDNYYLDYYVPVDEEGNETGNIWFDGWVIPTTSPNKLAATMFIDFMNAPENAIYNSIYIGYTSAVAREKMMFTYVGEGGEFDKVDDEYVPSDNGEYALNEDVYSALVDSEYAVSPEDNDGEYDFSFFEDTRRYPEESEKLGVMRDFGDRQDNITTLWENAKVGNDVPWELIWCTVAIVGAGLLFALYVVCKNFYKRRPRKLED